MPYVRSRAEILEQIAQEPKKKPSWIRTSAFQHRLHHAFHRRLMNDRASVESRARAMWLAQAQAIEVALLRLPVADRLLLESRNEARYGSPIPSFESLLEQAARQHSDINHQFESALSWALRPDLYEERYSEWSGYSFKRRMKISEQRLSASARPSLEHLPLRWLPSGDPLEPLTSTRRSKKFTIRVNEFPDEPLYTLVENGAKIGDFDDWPATWQRL
jgi:hypothetical protein